MLDSIIHSIGAATGTLQVADAGGPSVEIVANVGLTDQDMAQYATYYSKCDPWVREGLKQPLDRAYRFSNLVAPNSLEKSEFWNDFGRRVGPGLFYGIGAGLKLGPSKVGLIGLQRPRNADDFDNKERDHLTALLPHLKYALMVRDRLFMLEHAVGVAYSALDRLQTSVVIARADGTVIFANVAAQNLAKANDGFAMIGPRRRVSAGLPLETTHLLRLIARAAGTASKAEGISGGVLSLSRPSMRRSYSVVVSPLASRPGLPSAALVLITDPEQRSQAEPDRIAALYSLTPAETRLAVALVLGKSLRTYADETSLSVNTVRWTMKQLFSKTGTHRQSELIQLLTADHHGRIHKMLSA